MPKVLGCVICALVAACAPSLESPDQLLITCTGDSGCPNGWHCTSAGACAHGNDDAALTVFSVTSTSNTSVVVGFSKPLLGEVAGVVGRYQIDHDITVQAADLDLARTSVTLTTSQQQGRHYTLSLAADLIDVYGVTLDAASTSQTFLGTGDPVDETAPGLLTPVDESAVDDTNVTLSWTALRGATTYVVDVATTPDFTTPIPSSPWIAQAPTTQQTVTLPGPGSYYWRVTGDTTLPESVNLGRFALLESAIAVYCAADDDCEADALNPTAWENGNTTTPFKSIKRALNAALLRGTTDIHIAARGGGAYNETFEISGVFRIDGGWDPGFTNRDAATRVTTIAVNAPLRIIGSRGPADSIFDGFTIAPSVALDADLVISDCTNALTVTNVVSTSITVASTGLDGPLLSGLTATKVAMTGGATQLRDSTVTGALTVDTTEGAIAANVIGGAIATLKQNAALRGGVFGQLTFVSGMGLVDSAVITGIPGDDKAIVVEGQAYPDISNCVIGTPAAPKIVDIEVGDAAPLIHITNNTIFGSLELVGDTKITVTNNLIACIAADGVAAGQTPTDFTVLSFENNVAVGCEALYYTTEARMRTLYTTDVDLTALSSATERFANNTPLTSVLTDVFTSDGSAHVLAGAPDVVRHGGKDTTGVTCGPASDQDCGNVTDDKDEAARTTQISVGAYEVDP